MFSSIKYSYTKMILPLLFLILLLNRCSVHQLKVDDRTKAAMDKVDTADIRAHIRYLADDKLKGRLPGTEGYQMAVDYVIRQFSDIGLQPAGDNGSYIQKLIIRKSTLNNQSVQAAFTGARGSTDSLVFGKDFIVQPHPLITQQEVTAGIAFAGYGIDAPAMKWNDYAMRDVKGKIVIVLRGAPEGLPSALSAHFANVSTKASTALAHGAVGLLMVSAVQFSPDTASSVFSNNMALTPDKNDVLNQVFGGKDMKVMGWITPAALRQFFLRSGENMNIALENLKERKKGFADVTGTLKIKFTTRHTDIESYNVAALIPGSDPILKNEYVVHTAHLDHLGVDKAVNGDSIYNGAHDNASGVACLLEIGRIYKTAKLAPKRSVLLAAVTGEEMGLLGSAYLAAYPTVPKKSIVANVNTDMPTVIAPLLSIVPLGAEHSSLIRDVQFATAYLGIDIEKDPEPEQNRFVRSDQYSFVKQGIPALHIKYGNKMKTKGASLTSLVQSWRSTYYHKPTDDINGVFDFMAAKKYVQLNFLIGYSIAQNKEKPRWNAGDVFNKTVAQKNVAASNALAALFDTKSKVLILSAALLVISLFCLSKRYY
ncbi:MAG: M28 family peptidase [Bacteroidota bacterium]|nr:M28 family peptidase [Bacteroidota bacterium]